MIGTLVIGSGNIGTDLMIKLLRGPGPLRMDAMAGIAPASDGLARGARLGVATTAGGAEGWSGCPASPGSAWSSTRPQRRRTRQCRGTCAARCAHRRPDAAASAPFVYGADTRALLVEAGRRMLVAVKRTRSSTLPST